MTDTTNIRLECVNLAVAKPIYGDVIEDAAAYYALVTGVPCVQGIEHLVKNIPGDDTATTREIRCFDGTLTARKGGRYFMAALPEWREVREGEVRELIMGSRKAAE